MSLVAKIVSKFDDSGIRKAKSGFGGLTKTLGAIGIGFGLKQMTDGLLDAAKAASIDAKSMQLLNNQLVRNANATDKQVAANNKFIDSLALQVGIADDQLRPAQARLARATGSTAKSQELLKLALDASAVSGRPLESVSTALAKAFNGNTTSLKRMFPELSKSKDIISDLTKTVKGAAEEQADPFARMNVAFGELQEKLGAVILPYMLDFIDTMMKPGGAIDQVGKFLEDVSNPKTEAGQVFVQVKDTVTGLSDTVVNLGTIISNLFSLEAKAMPLMNDLHSFFDLIEDITNGINNAGDALDKLLGKSESLPGAKGKDGKPTTVQPNLFDQIGRTFLQATNPLLNIGSVYSGLQSNFGGTPNNVTINVQGGDPKVLVDTLGKYVKQNGSLPFKLVK